MMTTPSDPTPNRLADEPGLDGLRWAIAKQIVKAKVPGYKMTRGELHDEASHVPAVYMDNIMADILRWHTAEMRVVLERLKEDRGYEDFVPVEAIDAELDKLKEGI
jgi:hypothetical protein